MYPADMVGQPARSRSLGGLGKVKASQAQWRRGWGFRLESRFGTICGRRECGHLHPWPQVLEPKEVGTELAHSVQGTLERLWKAVIYARGGRLCSPARELPDRRCPNLAQPYGLTSSLLDVDHCAMSGTLHHHHRATAGMTEVVRVAQWV